jgi:hypothetical protein
MASESALLMVRCVLAVVAGVFIAFGAIYMPSNHGFIYLAVGAANMAVALIPWQRLLEWL